MQGPKAGRDLVATLLSRDGPRCLGTWGCRAPVTAGLLLLQPRTRGHMHPKATAASLAPGTTGPCSDV